MCDKETLVGYLYGELTPAERVGVRGATCVVRGLPR